MTTTTTKPRAPRARKAPTAPAIPAAPLLSVFVPGKPVILRSTYGRGKYWRNRVYLTKEAEDWERDVKYTVQQKLGLSRPPSGQLEVYCTFRGVRGDADNYLKTTLDGLKYGLDIDDRYFNPVVARKEPKRGRPQGVLIEVWEPGTKTA